MELSINIANIGINIEILKMMFLQLFTYIIYFKITNVKINKDFRNIFISIIVAINALLITFIRYKMGYFIAIFILIIIQSIICSKLEKREILNTFIIVCISLSINYILYFLGIVITFFINLIYPIKSDLINILLLIFIQSVFMIFIWKIKRIKNGISYLNTKKIDDYFNIVALNISIIILYCFVIFSNMKKNIVFSKELVAAFVIFSFIMFFTIKKSIEAYYKQKLLIQDLNETKKELDEKRNEIKELEAENLKISKKAHSLAHKQKSLEFKINKILMNTESAEELGLENELKNISKELINSSKLPKLNKTGISEIDDMFNVMQEECRLNGIDFVLQLKGNIYQMTNHYITKEELSILLADHIKDAIIAINHSDNINKSIMVRLGKIEDCFAVYFYDSGVEFTKEVLDNLGKKPITTYSDEGGTGMGFMNTFDLLNKYNASLIIEKIGSPCKDNYTKIIKIKFDNKKELII